MLLETHDKILESFVRIREKNGNTTKIKKCGPNISECTMRKLNETQRRTEI